MDLIMRADDATDECEFAAEISIDAYTALVLTE